MTATFEGGTLKDLKRVLLIASIAAIGCGRSRYRPEPQDASGVSADAPMDAPDSAFDDAAIVVTDAAAEAIDAVARDAGDDAGNDAGSDAGRDAGNDAGNDAGSDAGAPPCLVWAHGWTGTVFSGTTLVSSTNHIFFHMFASGTDFGSGPITGLKLVRMDRSGAFLDTTPSSSYRYFSESGVVHAGSPLHAVSETGVAGPAFLEVVILGGGGFLHSEGDGNTSRPELAFVGRPVDSMYRVHTTTRTAVANDTIIASTATTNEIAIGGSGNQDASEIAMLSDGSVVFTLTSSVAIPLDTGLAAGPQYLVWANSSLAAPIVLGMTPSDVQWLEGSSAAHSLGIVMSRDIGGYDVGTVNPSGRSFTIARSVMPPLGARSVAYALDQADGVTRAWVSNAGGVWNLRVERREWDGTLTDDVTMPLTEGLVVEGVTTDVIAGERQIFVGGYSTSGEPVRICGDAITPGGTAASYWVLRAR
jgi:hypothetical protein